MTKFRLAIIAAAFTALVAFAGFNWYVTLHRSSRNFTTPGEPSLQLGGPFTLTDQNGQPATERLLKGKWTAVFFGYTYCPDFCPLTLQNLGLVQKQLGGKAKDFQVVFISVDPARDTPASLKAYLDSGGMPKGAIGLTGTQAQVDQATKEYRTVADRVGTGDTYSFQHTTTVYLMDPEGRYNTAFTYDLAPDTAAKLIEDAMAGR